MASYYKLYTNREPGKMTYDELLDFDEWQEKRQRVLKRDQFTCRDCKVMAVNNHVHHSYYIRHCLPWEVPDECLVTLCELCHSNEHQKVMIPTYQYVGGKLSIVDLDCTRCGGTGYLKQYEHVDGGRCFKCHGHGYTPDGVMEILPNDPLRTPKPTVAPNPRPKPTMAQIIKLRQLKENALSIDDIETI
jgi:hypothetical protein